MLCRTANELYWMGRHIERAENTARLLDVTYRMALLPYELIEPGLAWAEPWAVPLITSGLASDFYDTFQQLSARYSGTRIAPVSIGPRPTLDWDACITDAASAKQFRDQYYKALLADKPRWK